MKQLFKGQISFQAVFSKQAQDSYYHGILAATDFILYAARGLSMWPGFPKYTHWRNRKQSSWMAFTRTFVHTKSRWMVFFCTLLYLQEIFQSFFMNSLICQTLIYWLYYQLCNCIQNVLCLQEYKWKPFTCFKHEQKFG